MWEIFVFLCRYYWYISKAAWLISNQNLTSVSSYVLILYDCLCWLLYWEFGQFSYCNTEMLVDILKLCKQHAGMQMVGCIMTTKFKFHPLNFADCWSYHLGSPWTGLTSEYYIWKFMEMCYLFLKRCQLLESFQHPWRLFRKMK